MMELLRTRVLPWGAWLLAMSTAGWLWLGLGQGSAQGFVEPVVYAINAPQVGRVASLTVEVGQQVRGGDVIATLDGTELSAELDVLVAERARVEAELTAVGVATKVRLSEAGRGIEEAIDAADRAHQAARADRNVRAAELAALRRQIAHMRELVDNRMADRRELAPLQVSQAALDKQLQQADALIRQLDRQAASARARRGGVPSDAAAQATQPLYAELAVLDLRKQLLQVRKESLTLRAPGDGEVTAIHVRAGETATQGSPIATITSPASWHGDAPTVRVCLDEKQAATVVAGEAVALYSPGRRGSPLPAHLTQVGGEVAQLPARCWTDPRVPMWGRSAYVTIDASVSVVAGQSFAVDFLGEPSPHAGEDGAKPNYGSTPAAVAVFAPPTKPADLTVPDALSSRTRLEPSGVVWVSSLQRYVLVSDDTGHPDAMEHAPWLFTMDIEGRVDDAPLVIAGLQELRDVEAIAAAPDGGLYVLSSQGFSRRGKRHEARQQFVHVTLDEGRATASAQVTFAELLDAAGPAALKPLGLDDTTQLEIEGLSSSADGGLLMGLKAPLSPAGEALIWRLASPDALLSTGELGSADLSLWGTTRLAVMADGVMVPAGISDLLELADHSLLVTATASGRADPKRQDGALVHIAGPEGAAHPRTLATFDALKPEGLAHSHRHDAIVVVFDAGSKTPKWLEHPWPAS